MNANRRRELKITLMLYPNIFCRKSILENLSRTDLDSNNNDYDIILTSK